MSTALQTQTQTQALATADEWTNSKIELVKRMLAPGISNDQLDLFIATCKRLQLDPVIKQIYPVLRDNKRTGRKEMAIQVGIDGLRAIADRTGSYCPGRPTDYEYDDKGRLVSATAYVKKYAHGEWHEYGERALLSECKGTVGGFWGRIDHTMLAKCSEAKGIRKGWPVQAGGVYIAEELLEEEPQQVVAAEIVMPEIEWESVIDQCVTHSALNGVAQILSTLKGAARDAARQRWTERKKEIDEENELDAIAGRDAE